MSSLFLEEYKRDLAAQKKEKTMLCLKINYQKLPKKFQNKSINQIRDLVCQANIRVRYPKLTQAVQLCKLTIV